MGSTSLVLTSAAAPFTISRGECAHCAMPWILPLTCVQVACSAVPALLWNSFHPCATPDILHHSGRQCVGQAQWLSLGLDIGVHRSVSLHGTVCMILSASLATATSILFFPELFMPRCQYNTMAVKEGFLGRGMSSLSFTVMLRERYGASGG